MKTKIKTSCPECYDEKRNAEKQEMTYIHSEMPARHFYECPKGHKNEFWELYAFNSELEDILAMEENIKNRNSNKDK